VRVAPGEIVLEGASRSFSVRADRGRTLREAIMRRAGSGPPPVEALRDVSLHVRPGEAVGIVGRNGAGKSSTLRVLAGIVPLHSGRVACGGRVVSLLELGAGFSRDFSGRENIHLNGALHGLTRAQVEERIDDIVEFSELGGFIDVPVKTYSSGMYVRLGFAIAAHLDADVMLIDEVLAVGDEAFQRKCLRRIREQMERGATLVLVSHDPGAIERVCERVVVIDAGRVVFDGPAAEGLLFYHRLMGSEDGAPEDVRRPRERAVQVTGITLRDGDGRRCEVFRSGEPLRVELELAGGDRATGEATVVIEVRDEHGRAVFRTSAAVGAADGGGGAAVFEVPRLALLGGDYDLAAAALDAEDVEGEAVAFDRVARFSVAPEAGAEGIADLRGAWSTGAGVETVS
jgi:ABC-type polysaccharide/polyol phosphate transport system ATPase subunit